MTSGTNSPSNIDDPLLDTPQAGEFLNINHGTLMNWRSQGIGPAFIKVGSRMVRYKLSDLMAFRDSGKAA